MITRCRPLLGTFVEITVPVGQEAAADRSFAAVEHVHRAMSFHEGGSDLARLRAATPGEAIEVDAETVRVLRLALDLFRATDGLFDVTTGRQLVRAGFLPRAGIARLAAFPGTSADIEVVDDHHIRLARRVLIDLGGIAKGHAVDRAIEALTDAGVAEGLVNAGGDLRVFGDRDWPVALRDADDVVRHAVQARNCAMASSANLMNRRRFRGQEQSPHIGRGGRPVLTTGRVSVVAPRCILADAMTKVAMADPELAGQVMATYGGYLLASPSNGNCH
ncbi:FAD:protein FMN transferase [Sphingopyxis sp. GW247-27LB]|uniref:FAD:protein FMN transferase n=1 Tax=Sphingopyxis sp. GW247-27LB TaxID=2012632 RepID=UPI000BA68984|nr:FAD:protein FMN transferase [Sphingopyxis sp. GW247-27LB]PAL19783.1 hypothetical protein CD928_20565 [Sphingopyxis sp. GW247-27LB]